MNRKPIRYLEQITMKSWLLKSFSNINVLWYFSCNVFSILTSSNVSIQQTIVPCCKRGDRITLHAKVNTVFSKIILPLFFYMSNMIPPLMPPSRTLDFCKDLYHHLCLSEQLSIKINNKYMKCVSVSIIWIMIYFVISDYRIKE